MQLRRFSFRLATAVLAVAAPIIAESQAQAAQMSVRYRVVRNVAQNDTLNAAVVNRNAVIYSDAGSQSYGPGGQFEVRWHGDAFGQRNNRQFRLGPLSALQGDLDESLAGRPVASRTVTDEAVRSLPNFPAAAARQLIAAAVPFEVIGPSGTRAELAMFQRHERGNSADSVARNSRVFGTRGDTVRVQVRPDVWLPGDTLYVIENVGMQRTVTLRLTLACAPTGDAQRTTCNPLALNTRGATGYLPLDSGYVSVWRVPAGGSR